MLIHSTCIYPVRLRPKHQVFYFAKVFSGQDLWINEIFSEYGTPVNQNPPFAGRQTLPRELSSKPCIPWRQKRLLNPKCRKPCTTSSWLNTSTGRTWPGDTGTQGHRTGNTDRWGSCHLPETFHVLSLRCWRGCSEPQASKHLSH